jgi:hypothetical protein
VSAIAIEELAEPYETPADDAGRAAFTVDGVGKASWAMQKLAALKAARDEVRAVAEAEINRWQDWAAVEDQKLGQNAAWFEAILTAYALRVREESNGRTKTVSTPHGKVSTREAPGEWAVDAATVIEWAWANRPDLVVTKESLALSEAKKALTVADGHAIDPTTGEAVPGIEVGPSRMVASVKLAA